MLAVNFVLNVEEGSEPSVQDGDGFSETNLSEVHGRNYIERGRNLAAETCFEYGSRVGFWRTTRIFAERGMPLTMFACALALERNPEIAAAIRASGYDVCSHGWRWERGGYFGLSVHMCARVRVCVGGGNIPPFPPFPPDPRFSVAFRAIIPGGIRGGYAFGAQYPPRLGAARGERGG